MAFDWKSLIFVQEEGAATTPQKIESSTPTVSNTTPNKNPGTVTAPKNIVQEVLAVYEKGFEGLNQEGYDFFEMYKAVMAVGADNPQSYTMAMAMAKGIQPNLSKQSLLEKANFYVTEIQKVHAGYAQKGNQKKAELANQSTTERSNLNAIILNLEHQITQLQSQLASNKAELEALDVKFAAPIDEMEQRIAANDEAKNTILNSIQKVINGINQNL